MGHALCADVQNPCATHTLNGPQPPHTDMQSKKPLIMDQHQSPFFHLPRELRDEVYHYYVWEECGYSHHSGSATLRAANGNTPEILLQRTCKRVAKEMDGLLFRTNEIIFRTMLSPPNITEQPSNAFLYEQLLEERGSRLRYMLQWAHSMVSVETMQELTKRYPRNLAVQRMTEEISITKKTDLRFGYLPTAEVLDSYNDESVLQDLVEVLATYPDFGYLTSREYDEDLRKATGPEEDDEDLPSENESYYSNSSDEPDNEEPPCYSKETQMAVLQWKPKAWWIPDRRELGSVLKFLPPWPTAPPKPPVPDAWTPYMYFSAAAVATRFLEGLSPNISRHLRKIVLQEDRLSVSRSKTHAQAFIPLCIANPDLRIERRVDVWYTEFVHRSKYFDNYARAIVESIAVWINEVKISYHLGMPAGCFNLVLQGPSKEASQQLCDAVVRAAIWQDGAVEIARREQRVFDYDEEGAIAEDFVDVIKEMLRGEIPARFDDADTGEIWDIEKILREHDGDWPRHVGCVVRLQDFDEPDGGWEAAREVYEENVEWMDRINGWRRLAEEE